MKFNKQKMLSSVMCASMIFGNISPVFATEVTEPDEHNHIVTTDDTKETEVLYTQSASYFVSIPKTIVLGTDKTSNYSVKVSGDIPSDKNVYVAPIDQILETTDIDFYMVDQSKSNPKADVEAIVTPTKTNWNFQDVADAVEVTDNGVEANKLTSGEWKGIFNFEINMKSLVSSNEDEILTLSVEDEVAIGTDGSMQVNAYVEGELANDLIDWSSNNENITVDNGLIETKASAQVGDSATITASLNLPSEVSLFNNDSTNYELSKHFTVTIIDMVFTSNDEIVSVLNVKPNTQVDVEATIIPGSVNGTVIWSSTATSGLNLIKNGNKVTIKIADDMKVGNNYLLIANYGDYSKYITINIIDEEHKHNYVVTTEKDASCIEDGYKTYMCECGDSYTDNLTKLGHNLSENGECTRCDYVEPVYATNFADNSWSDIAKACQNNEVPETWNVGDVKTMQVGEETYEVVIIGKNHDTYADGSGTAPLTFQLKDTLNTPYAMRIIFGNDSWDKCKMYDILNTTIFDTLETDVKNNIKAVSKVTNVGYSVAGSTIPTTTRTTADKLFLLSVIEVFGTETAISITDVYAQEGIQYAYYTDNASRIKCINGTMNNWWLRTPAYKYGGDFNFVNNEGCNVCNNAYMGGIEERGVSFAFCF